MYDKLIQQCIKQVMEPICEAKFYDNSYAFRPDRSVEHAIARCYQYLQIANLHYVVEFDIKGFFDHVNHKKLIHATDVQQIEIYKEKLRLTNEQIDKINKLRSMIDLNKI